MRLVGREELIEDPAYATPEARLSHLPDCFGIIQAWTSRRSKIEVMQALNEIDVPCGPILSMKDLIDDRSMYDRGMLVEVPHPERGNYIQVASPIRLSDNDVPVERSPLLGEHTEEILASVGFDADAIAAMRTAGAI
jgi:formyl-CoA transferase